MRDATRLIWVAVAESGRCTRLEIRKAMPSLPAKVIRDRVRNMLDAGMLKKYPDGAVGVTKDCTFPQGLTVAAAFRAMGVN